MKRYLVIFSSDPEPPCDATAVDVDASSEIGAIAAARRKASVPHPWTLARAVPWPRGCRGVDAAVARLASAR